MLVDKTESAKKKQVKKKKKNQSGRSLIEMIGVLSIMALITAGAFVLISSASESQKRNRVIDDMVEIATGARSLYAEYDALPTISSGTLLAALGKSTTGPYSGSTYSVARVSDTSFSVKLTGLPDSDCSALGIKEWKIATAHSCDKDKGGNWVISITINK